MSAHRTPPSGTAATTEALSGESCGAVPRGGTRPARRLLGVDAARGLALFGMVAVHTLPSWDEQTGAANLSWTLFAGHSAALFATLAGVSLAFASGGRTPRTGRRTTATRWALAGRAGVIALVGFLLGFLELPVSNILIYYGLLFLLAVPFLRLRTRSLLLWAALFALVAPFLMQWSLDVLPGLEYANPSLVDLARRPGHRPVPAAADRRPTPPCPGWRSCWPGWPWDALTWHEPEGAEPSTRCGGRCGPADVGVLRPRAAGARRLRGDRRGTPCRWTGGDRRGDRLRR